MSNGDTIFALDQRMSVISGLQICITHWTEHTPAGLDLWPVYSATGMRAHIDIRYQVSIIFSVRLIKWIDPPDLCFPGVFVRLLPCLLRVNCEAGAEKAGAM